MNNKKKILAMLTQAREKQEEAEKLLFDAMKVVGAAMDVDNLEDVEKEKLEQKAIEIIKAYVKENGNLLYEGNQRELFFELTEVNYKHQGLSYILKDCGIRAKYRNDIELKNLVEWKPLEIISVGDEK
ncbi:MAG: hypothetical protein ACRCW0_05195 [Clostridium sp.]